MKKIMVIVWAICASGVWAQNTPANSDPEKREARNRQIAEAPLNVRYVSKQRQELSPIYYVNRNPVSDTFLNTLDPQKIDNIEVIKELVEVYGKSYQGSIYITLKQGYQPAILSFNELVSKYLKLDDSPVLFTIDEKLIIVDDYDEALVDENFILSIEAEKVDKPKENLNYWLVRLTTRSIRDMRVRGDKPDGQREGPRDRPRRRSMEQAL